MHKGIAGLTLIEDFIGPDTERELLNRIEAEAWQNPLKRRVQHYGYRYDYKRRSVDSSQHLGPLPPWLVAIAERLHLQAHFPTVPDQCIINEYEPGQGISPHVDCEPCFGDVIASLSLASGCEMEFTAIDTPCRICHYLPPRSLLLLVGEARYRWKHGIRPRLTDVVDGETVARGRRVSATFRSVIVSDPQH